LGKENGKADWGEGEKDGNGEGGETHMRESGVTRDLVGG
jgi:hypothetical protein